ncbi:MAG: hypothetical protein AVDCRST_MAG25-2374 [uncultured Rubrobacteraceae bacterium]|uniref:Uncharacterized protein n=1 Tax=uncultured Rubrobacteraceae bacterium TaxID=349277 RepID=A0A6J4RR86_9ACTN|nr:MAG: hypothetical protein AVDCRST_MAG25-2374 [uncultured Rubrobacteraceae bacterium]
MILWDGLDAPGRPGVSCACRSRGTFLSMNMLGPESGAGERRGEDWK